MQFKIMNVLLSESSQFLAAPLLLCRSTRPFRRAVGEDGSWVLEGQGKFDFTTYFNALSIQKWRNYSTAKKFYLHLELKGSDAVIYQTRADSYSYYSEEIEGSRISVDASDGWITLDFELAANDRDVITSFAIECSEQLLIRNSYYYVDVDASDIRPVELALCTTTFKKEEFIQRNIDAVRSEILGSNDLIAGHFTMHVVDNGRTLDAAALSGEAIYVHPNDNVGGAGGFARGMIEAMEQVPRASHVLLMDDDVLVSTESIIRTFNLLSLVNSEYEGAFVSGAMMNLDEPNMRWEEMGFINFEGACRASKPVARMDVLHDVVANEAFDVPSYMPYCEDQDQSYAAWWYCVIPMTQIEKHGLPLPIFVRGDDVEYSRRCKPNFITMNGICIWHMSFHMRYNAAQERYQMVRNCFIDQFASDFAPLSDFETWFKEAVVLELKKFNYDDASLLLDGFEDFLKGPEWLVSDEARNAFLDANKRAAKTLPLNEVYQEAEKLGVDLTKMTDWKIYRDLPYSRRDKLMDDVSLNGNRILTNVTKAGKIAVIDNVGWANPRGKLHGAEIVITIDIPNRRGSIRRIDRKRYRELWKRFSTDLDRYKASKSELKDAYKNARPEITSVKFWKEYLRLDD